MTGQAIRKIAAIQSGASNGKTARELAAEIGVTTAYVYSLAKNNGIVLPKRAAPAKHPKVGRKKYTVSAEVRFQQLERALEFAKLYREGKTLQQIASLFGVTRERVRQVMTKEIGIRAKDGGQRKQSTLRKRQVAERYDAKCLATKGCSAEQYRKLRSMPKVMGAFHNQRSNAIARGLGWEMSLWQWWTIWQTSGHWHDRGRGKNGYCMCRHNDSGPYAVDNVYIATQSENMKDYWVSQKENPTRSARGPILTYEQRRDRWRASNRAAYQRRKAAQQSGASV